ncbi:MAG: polysaccharide deacetylase [Clostridiales bacterium]|nr:polysaccharide deacetylase [Clostridiales bacterium]
MYNRENVKRIKIAIRVIGLLLIFVPTIILSIFSVQISKVKEENRNLLVQNSLLTSDKSDSQELEYGSNGRVILDVYSDMVVPWRSEPVYATKEKTIYLTFDDGPSSKTKEILDILDQYDVKATFFVTGTEDEELLPLYKEIVDRGHALGMHSYSHDYDLIYSSTEAFLADMYKIYSLIKTQTGTAPVLFRYPGGSTNDWLEGNAYQKEIINEMEARGFIYHDWNVSSGDSSYYGLEAKEIHDNVINGIGSKTRSVVLMHDRARQGETVAALPSIIEELKANGYKFDKLTTSTKPFRFE